MISEKEKSIISDAASKFKVKRLFLFGSALTSNQYNDIDLAVEGIKPYFFYKFHSQLSRNLIKPVDLVDLSSKSKSVQLIREDAQLIYG